MSARTLRSLAILVALAACATPAWASWSYNGSVVSTAAGDQSNVRTASDGSGGAIVVWTDSRSGGQDIYAQRIDGNGARLWSTSDVAICTATGTQSNPDIVSDGTHGAFVIWLDSRNPSNQLFYIQHVTSTGAIASGWPVNGMSVSDSANYAYHAALTPDGAGGAIVAWEDYRGTSADVYAQRITSGGTRLWSLAGAGICKAAGDQTNPAAISDGTGGAYFAWQDQRDGINVSDIYVQRVSAAGDTVAGWPKNGSAASPTPPTLRTAVGAALTSDGAGGMIVVWEDYRNVNAGIYGLRLTSGNTPPSGWSAGGIAICDTIGDQTEPIVTADGSGGALVAWRDWRNAATAPDLYAQRVTASGARSAGWLTSGVAVCTATGDQTDPCIVADGSGGAILAWYDFRAGTNTDIWAQRLNATGGIPTGWGSNGNALCTAAGDQQGPAAVTDGGSGAIVAWSDYRSGSNYDVYATRVTAGVLDVPATVPASLRLGEPRPNPSIGPATLGFDLPAGCAVRAQVLDPAGRIVRTLERGWFAAGSHALVWNGTDERGDAVAPGVYLVRVEAGRAVMIRRIVRLR